MELKNINDLTKEDVLKIFLKIEELEKENKDLKKRKRYGLVWEDQEEDVEKLLKSNYPVLSEVKEREVLKDKVSPTNLLIEGDNLHSLNSLLYTHKGAAFIAYLDPPYFTGNKDFIYNDNFVNKEDVWRHSKWLSFMSKRLKIAKELLSDDGAVFISIDDNEQSQLKLLCDEIFGEQNFVANLIRKSTGGKQDAGYYSQKHEYMLVYAKNKPNFIPGREITEIDASTYKEYDEIKKKFYKKQLLRKWGDNSRKQDRPNLYYPIYINLEKNSVVLSLDDVDNKESYVEMYPTLPNGQPGCWRWGQTTMIDNIADGRVLAMKQKGKEIEAYEKLFVPDELIKTSPYPTLIDDTFGNSGKSLINDILGKALFDYPKPVELIKRVIKMVDDRKDVVVLDFFAGSGTTGQAVLELNKEDGGNRQFILCTNNENNICEEITYERLKRVMNGYTTPKGKKVEGLGGNLKYYKTDFVDKNQNYHDLKNELFNKSMDLIAIKENAYELLSDTDEFKILKGNRKMVGVYLDYDVDYDVLNSMKEILQEDESNEKILYVPDGLDILRDAKLVELQESGIDIKKIPSKIMEILEGAIQ